jgi:NhaP-type Na+/H+ or K+/H+ antiporter
VGALLGSAIGRLVLYLRRTHREGVGLDDFLALGLIALSYGTALALHAYGFLAVFAAGLALRRIEKRSTRGRAPEEIQELARSAGEHESTHPDSAPAYMASAVLGFNEQLERMGEVTMVVILGILLATTPTPVEAWWFAPLLLLVIRPLSVMVALAGSGTSGPQRWLMSWFGIRGIGSLYYLFYAINHGLDGGLARRIEPLVLTLVAISIFVHGLSVTPLMQRYARTHPEGAK